MKLYENMCKATHKPKATENRENSGSECQGDADQAVVRAGGVGWGKLPGVGWGVCADRAGEGQGFPWGAGRQGEQHAPRAPAAAAFRNRPVPRSRAPEPWLVTCSPGWGLSSHMAARPTWCHLEMTREDGVALSQVLSPGVWPSLACGPSRCLLLGCLRREMREECGRSAVADGDPEKRRGW